MQVAPPPSSRSADSSFARPRPPSSTTAIAATAASTSKPEYIVVSAARQPGGAASHLSPSCPDGSSSGTTLSGNTNTTQDLPNPQQQPEALHDTRFFEAVSKELPGCPVLHSLLYSHRSVVNDGPTPDQALAEVDDSVAKWKEAEKMKAMANLSKTLLFQLKEEQTEVSKDVARRDEDHERTMHRIDRIASTIEKRFESSVAETTTSSSSAGGLTIIENKAKWDSLRQRHEIENEQLLRRLEHLADDDEVRKRYEAALEFVTVSSKLQVSEKLQHCLLLSEEERERLLATYESANSKNRVLLAEDEASDRAPIVASEARSFETIRLHYGDLTQRAMRAWRTQQMISGLQNHTQASEHGLRYNVDYEEERYRRELLASYVTTTSVASLVDNVVQEAAALVCVGSREEDA